MKVVAALSLAGLVVSLIGVLLLFRYGMPYRVETRGRIYRVIEQEDEAAKTVERRYRMLGNIGLALVVVGTLLQAAGACLS